MLSGIMKWLDLVTEQLWDCKLMNWLDDSMDTLLPEIDA